MDAIDNSTQVVEADEREHSDHVRIAKNENEQIAIERTNADEIVSYQSSAGMLLISESANELANHQIEDPSIPVNDVNYVQGLPTDMFLLQPPFRNTWSV